MTELTKNVTILIVTRRRQQAARFSDYRAFMYLGEMLEFSCQWSVISGQLMIMTG